MYKNINDIFNQIGNLTLVIRAKADCQKIH